MQKPSSSASHLETALTFPARLICDARQKIRFIHGSSIFEKTFPQDRIGVADCVLGSTFIVSCFLLFFHDDIWGVGWDSLNYIFGSPLDFYENCKRIRGGGQNMVGTPYPPTIYMIFAVWIYPLKLLGLLTGPENFPHYLTYWLKILTTIVYCGSAGIFYCIAYEFTNNRDASKYAAAAWLTTPLALFSEFVFSQYDIFYVALTSLGFLFFIRRHLLAASLCLGVAVTFKYFPAFVFLPLLLFYEKRIYRIVVFFLIFLVPTLLFDLLYSQSPAFVEGVLNHSAIDRVYAATIDSGFMGYWRICVLPAFMAVLCGISYFLEPSETAHMPTAAYLWLISSIAPFLLIIWHPQWAMFFAAPIVVTSLLSRNSERLLLMDIVGMFLFIAAVSLIFRDNVDTYMFQGGMFGLRFDNAYPMAWLFEWFGSRSLNVFYSGFTAYLLLQGVLKYWSIFRDKEAMPFAVNYGTIRQVFYVGLLTFLLPASFAIYKDMAGHLHLVKNQGEFSIDDFGELVEGVPLEQTFVAEGRTMEYLTVTLKTEAHAIGKSFLVEVLDSSNHQLARNEETVTTSAEELNQDIRFKSIPVLNNSQYKIRLTSSIQARESAVTWLATSTDSYSKGSALVGGMSQKSDFLFRVVFAE